MRLRHLIFWGSWIVVVITPTGFVVSRNCFLYFPYFGQFDFATQLLEGSGVSSGEKCIGDILLVEMICPKSPIQYLA